MTVGRDAAYILVIVIMASVIRFGYGRINELTHGLDAANSKLSIVNTRIDKIGEAAKVLSDNDAKRQKSYRELSSKLSRMQKEYPVLTIVIDGDILTGVRGYKSSRGSKSSCAVPPADRAK